MVVQYAVNMVLISLVTSTFTKLPNYCRAFQHNIITPSSCSSYRCIISGSLYRNSPINNNDRQSATDAPPSCSSYRCISGRLYHNTPTNNIDTPYFKIFYNDVYEVDMPKGHRFPMKKYRKVREKVQHKIGSLTDEEKSKVDCSFNVSPLATKDQLLTTHDAEYVDRYLNGQMTEAENRNIGFPWSLQHVNRTLSSVGGTVAASLAAYEEYVSRQHLKEEKRQLSWAAHTAGGTHHAFRDYGEGFCIFSDIAVAANVLLQKYGPSTKFGQNNSALAIHRILIIDLDVHQGNGNAALFAENKHVKTFSIHCKGNYFSKIEVGDLDIELPIDCSDEGYLSTLQYWLNQIEYHTFDDHVEGRKQFDYIFFQAGVDIHVEDRLGRLSVSPEGISKRNEIVFDFANRLKAPLCITMGGGYPNKDWAPIVDAHSGVYIQAHNYLANI